MHRYGRRAVDVALLKIVNYIVKQVDTTCLTAIGAAVPSANQIAATVSDWTSASGNILFDLLNAAAKIASYDQGYEADTVVTTDLGVARILADSKIIGGTARETPASITMSGNIPQIAGLRILATNNIPTLSGAKAFVLDSSMVGGLAYERLESPEYAGDPANGVESWTRRDPAANDQWLVRGRRPVVPIIQEPSAIVAITGTTG